MQGYQLSFFSSQNRQHHGQPIANWLLQTARQIGIRGATLIPASEGFGHHGRIHSAHFFELGDQPQEVIMAVTADEAERLFEMLKSEKVKIFYIKVPIEFAMLGEEK